MASCSPVSDKSNGAGRSSVDIRVAAKRQLARVGRSWLRMKHVRRFEAATYDVKKAQERKLLRLVEANRDTAYGREYGFGSIRGLADFQSRVPVAEYENFEPYVQRLMRGERNVLTRESPVMFALSSGTTGAPKYVPVTPQYVREYNHAVQVHTSRIAEDYPEVVLGSVLVTSSCDVEGHTEAGIPYGAISGFLARRQPGIVKRWFALPDGIGRIKDVDAKYYATLLLALQQDVRVVISVSPSSLVLLADKMLAHGERLVRDLHDGTLSPDVALSDASRALVNERLRPCPETARRLGNLMEREGGIQPRDAWPNLGIISCWKGGTMPMYLDRLRRSWGPAPVRDFGYMASEGRGSIPLADDGASGVLALSSHFFEFIPKGEVESDHPTCLTADQLETGEEYFVLFTTSSGLYRYHINDLVRVTGHYRSTPLIEFVRKGQGVSSVAGEKLSETQVTAALQAVTGRTGIDLRHFSAAPRWGEPPHYVLMLELGRGAGREQLQRFILEFDDALSEMNVEYRSKRQSCRLGAPVLHVLAPGSFDRHRQNRVLAGTPETQVKVPHLSPDVDWGRQFSVTEEVSAPTSPKRE